jgi:hypothetical protein
MRFLFLLAALTLATPALAQTTPSVDAKYVFGVSGQFDALQRAGAGFEAFIPAGRWHCEDGLCGGRSIEIQGSAASGGWRVAAGPALMAYPLWFDLLGTVMRTSAAPRGAAPESTYVGVEGGFAFPVHAWAYGGRYLTVRPSIGVTHNLGPAAGFDQTTFTWSVGLHYVWPKF